MPDASQPHPRRNLSAISHLFLSDVRDRQTGHAPPPRRTPPPANVSIDLTAEEFARMYGGADAGPLDGSALRIAPVSAVLGSHLNGRQFDRVKEYARHLAGRGERVGLIELDASEFRLMCFDCVPDGESAAVDEPVEAVLEPRRMDDSLYELNWDVDRWLLLLPNPRTPEAHDLLRLVDHWTVLSTCDHDGIVSCYRTLKGLNDGTPPTLTIGLLDARDDSEADRVHRKLSSVCRQFLGWTAEGFEMVLPAHSVAEHGVLVYRPVHDKGQLAAAPQWLIVSRFLTRARNGAESPEETALRATSGDTAPVNAPSTNANEGVAPAAPAAREVAPAGREVMAPARDVMRPANEVMPPVRQLVVPAHEVAASGAAKEKPKHRHLADVVMPMSFPIPLESTVAAPAEVAFATTDAHSTPAAPFPAGRSMRLSLDDGTGPTQRRFAPADSVVDVPGDGTPATILAALLGAEGANLVECPVRAPMCPDARLSVARDGRLILAGMARRGLDDLSPIVAAHRWLAENASLVAMAMPQMVIDSKRAPELRLFIDHADRSAGTLRAIASGEHVSVRIYRSLSWHGKTGLLLDAA